MWTNKCPNSDGFNSTMGGGHNEISYQSMPVRIHVSVFNVS